MNIRAFVKKIDLIWIVFAICLLAYFSYFLFLSFSRHSNYLSLRLDLGNMDQTVWNVARGNGFVLTDPMGENEQSRLAIHADFLLIVLAPLYSIWSDPRMLLLVQTIVVSLGAIPIYWFTIAKTKSKYFGLFFVVLFLLYPAIQRLLLHDFHSITLSITFLLFAFWYLEKKKTVLFIIFAFLSAIGKEDVWLVIGLFGLWSMFIQKRRVFGILTTLVGFGVFYILFWHAIPAVTPAKQHFALSYLSEFGGSLNGVLANIIINPISVVSLAFSSDRLWYYFQLLLPVGLLSLFSPQYLVFAVPALAVNILSSNGNMRTIDYQYTSAIIPFIFISAISGFSFIVRHIKKHTKKNRCIRNRQIVVMALVGICAAYATYTWGELPFAPTSRYKTFTRVPHHKAQLDWVITQIPNNSVVSATNNLGAHYSQRSILYNFPIGAATADYTVVLLGDYYAWPSADEQQKTVDALLVSPNHEVIMHKDNFYAFKKILYE